MRGDQRIGGKWFVGDGEPLVSIDPGSGKVLHRLREASGDQVAAAVRAASDALPEWSATPLAKRIEILKQYERELRDGHAELSESLSHETGKPRWEAKTEVDTMVAKVPVSIEMLGQRRAEQEIELPGAAARTRYRPIGVLGVLGPFNLPGHLPNGHIVPALLAGNTIVFKPSELTPGIGTRLIELLEQAGLPRGVVNLVHGGRAVGQALVSAQEIDGVLFTGSHAGGQAIARALADRPETLLALEMGGNNPLVVDEVEDVEAAVVHTLLSAYITSGQRCTCARRLIVPRGTWGDLFLARLVDRIRGLRIGLQADEPECFIGPMISATAAERIQEAERSLRDRGGRSLVPLEGDDRSSALLRPGLIDVSTVRDWGDDELFGPLLQLVRVADFDAAIEEANRTAYGLAAALFSDDPVQFERFVREVRAGVVNWNRATTGASGKLPFGGIGHSGNHRPAGAWAADYCSDPVATLESDALAVPGSLPPGLGGDGDSE
jgi:succinylglutamic semialdehyde dehydrogenase